jgi:hypothetical protein
MVNAVISTRLRHLMGNPTISCKSSLLRHIRVYWRSFWIRPILLFCEADCNLVVPFLFLKSNYELDPSKKDLGIH